MKTIIAILAPTLLASITLNVIWCRDLRHCSQYRDSLQRQILKMEGYGTVTEDVSGFAVSSGSGATCSDAAIETHGANSPVVVGDGNTVTWPSAKAPNGTKTKDGTCVWIKEGQQQ